ncbi:MAG: magnesium transporter CorA family protein [Porphyromonas sp.]|nr:magnesium transporter CorA family protein [Porphyromonas sp.]RKW46329.1 MAG: magnesium transporter CorA family protein [Porphyromonas sp.]
MRTYLSLEAGLSQLEEYTPKCWINIEFPDEDDLHFLTEELGVPSEFLADIADVDERPRTEKEDDWQLTILRIPLESNIQGLPYMTVPVGVITGKETTITVCYRKSQLIPDFISHIRRKSISITSQADFITRMIYSSAVWFLKYLKLIYLEINRAEKELEESVRNEDLMRIMRLQKSLVYFSTSIRGNEAMLGRLRTATRAGEIDPDLVEDVSIELRQAYNTINIYTDICNSTMDALGSIISNNVNTIMKRMTSLQIVLTIPTMIASFYGMNVDVYIAEWHYSFIAIMIISVIISAIAFVLFKRIKWF